MRITLLAPVLLFAACDGGSSTYIGVRPNEYFPMDGERTWTYAMDDESAGYLLHVEKASTATQEGIELITLEYSRDDTGDLLYSVTWSSDSSGGIIIYGYDVQGGDAVTFDTPVQFADYTMVSGDSVVTQTNDMTYTGTLVGQEDCTNLWTSDTWQCLHMHMDDGDGDDMVGAPFAGDWWIAGSWAASRFQPTGWNADWVLTQAYFCDPGSQDCGT